MSATLFLYFSIHQSVQCSSVAIVLKVLLVPGSSVAIVLRVLLVCSVAIVLKVLLVS